MMIDRNPIHLFGHIAVKALPIGQSALTHKPRVFIALLDLFQN